MFAAMNQQEGWMWMKWIFGLSAVGMLAVRVHLLQERLARRKAEREQSPPPRAATPEERAALSGRLLRTAAARFHVEPARLLEGARFTEDLRIPRGEVERLIEDLEIEQRMDVDPAAAARVATFPELVALFVENGAV